MRFLSIARLICLNILLPVVALATTGEAPAPTLKEMLPANLDHFRQSTPIHPLVSLDREGILPDMLRATTGTGSQSFLVGEVDYLAPDGKTLTVELLNFSAESDAYSLLTLVAERMRAVDPGVRIQPGGIGTVTTQSQKSVAFFKGTTFVRITNGSGNSAKLDNAIALARLLANRIDKGEGDVPVLLKHLPNWESAAQTAVYLVSLDSLKSQASNQSVFDALSFAGGSEAVAAKYGPSQFVIVEFTTPQLAVDNDWNIREKIKELSSQGKPVPTVYRRVGNYSVFVFNAPDEQTANQLVDQVKYEQVVQWLGDNPYWFREVQKRYTQTVLGTFVSVMKASGLAAILCFGIGGFFGALLFARRRAQQAGQPGYSDAGGMMRLNIDELSAETDAQRLLGPGKS